MRDEAASEVVGNILLVALTVVGLGGVGAAIYALPGPETAIHADMTVLDGAHLLKVRHLGGEPFAVGDARLSLTVDGAAVDVALGGFDLGPTWEIGEAVCLAGPGTACSTAYAGRQLTGLTLVVGKYIVTDWTGQVRP